MPNQESADNENAVVFNTPEEMINYLSAQKQLMQAYTLKHDVSFLEFCSGSMRLAADSKIQNDFWLSLQHILESATGKKWKIDITDSPVGQTIADKEELKTAEYQKDALDLPLVKAIMAEFSGAKIDSMVRKINQDKTSSEELFFGDDSGNFIEDEN